MSTENGESTLTLVKPGEMMRLATDVAGVCEKIVRNTAVNIKGKQYVKVEGWQSIATAHGCVAGARDVERIDGGIRAIGEIRRVDNGIVIATAEGFVGDDEKTWASRDEYAKRAMAQTRAISRACRSAFAHVVVLIDKDLSTTPAEEVPYGGFDDDNGNGKPAKITPKLPSSSFQDAKRVMQEPQGNGTWKDVICTYGKTDGTIRGQTLGHISRFAPKVMDSLYAKFVDPQEIKVLKDSDQPLRQGLIDWKVWALEQEQKRSEFDQRQANVEESWETDEIPMS